MNEAKDFTPEQREAYTIGHREGESCRDVDWVHALEDLMPNDMEITPENVSKYIEICRKRLTKFCPTM